MLCIVGLYCQCKWDLLLPHKLEDVVCCPSIVIHSVGLFDEPVPRRGFDESYVVFSAYVTKLDYMLVLEVVCLFQGIDLSVMAGERDFILTSNITFRIAPPSLTAALICLISSAT